MGDRLGEEITPRSNPPKAQPKKADEMNVEFEETAKAVLRDAMKSRGWTVDELANRLASYGFIITPGALANKISRGGFKAAFFLMCLEAMGKVQMVTRC
jgi:hypothetical protein